MKIRRGGLDWQKLQRDVLNGNQLALRALVRQAEGRVAAAPVTVPCEIRAVANGTGGTRLQFNGYASMYASPDTGAGYYEMSDWLGEYKEGVRAGAATKTLTEGADVIFCLNHCWDGAPMARSTASTLTFPNVANDTAGLPVEAMLDGSRADVYQVQSAMDAEELNAMSFAFYVVRQTWSPDYEQRDILEVDMNGGDVSIVTWPANPNTTGTTALRKQQGLALANEWRSLARVAQTEKRAGATLSAATLDVLTQVLDLINAADVAVDAAQPLLAELMGVPNPDDDGEADASTYTSGDGTETNSGPAPEAVRERKRLAEVNRSELIRTK